MKDYIFSKTISILFIFAIVFFAVFFRTYQLGNIPPGMLDDEAVNAMEGMSAIEKREVHYFFPSIEGRESLYIYLIGASTEIFGENQPWAARLPSVFLGVLGVLGAYLLAKELFDEDIGLISAFLVAVSFWHIVFSRIAFRAIMMPAVYSFALYFLIAAINRERKYFYFLGGLFFGLGFYSYIPYRIMPIVLLFCLPFFVLAKRKTKVRMAATYKGIMTYLLTGLVVALPIGMFFLRNPEFFSGRINSLSVFNYETPWKWFVWNLAKGLMMFTASGDLNPRHNLPGRPQLTLPEGFFFLIGLAMMLVYLVRGIRARDWQKSAPAVLLLVLWGGMLLPSILSIEGVPHALRSIGTIVPAYIMVAVGLRMVLYLLKEFLEKYAFGGWLLRLGVAALLISIVWINFNDYFNVYAADPEVQKAFLSQEIKIADYLNELPDGVGKYVLSGTDAEGKLLSSVQTVRFITSRDQSIHYVRLEELPGLILDPEGNYVILPLASEPGLLTELSERLNVELSETVTGEGVYVLSHGIVE